jgi:hypothetical protein
MARMLGGSVVCERECELVMARMLGGSGVCKRTRTGKWHKC